MSHNEQNPLPYSIKTMLQVLSVILFPVGLLMVYTDPLAGINSEYRIIVYGFTLFLARFIWVLAHGKITVVVSEITIASFIAGNVIFTGSIHHYIIGFGQLPIEFTGVIGMGITTACIVVGLTLILFCVDRHPTGSNHLEYGPGDEWEQNNIR